LADFAQADACALQLTQEFKKRGAEDGVVHSIYSYVESVILRHVIDLYRSGKLYGGYVEEAMRNHGYEEWTPEDVIAEAVIQGIEEWSSKELGISLPTR
jgi:hypothetical protein